jgi:hypothetical protein
MKPSFVAEEGSIQKIVGQVWFITNESVVLKETDFWQQTRKQREQGCVYDSKNCLGNVMRSYPTQNTTY